MTSSQKSDRAVHLARIVDAREVAPSHYQLRFRAPQLALAAQPGQFVHVLTVPNATSWIFDPLLRRAFSIMSVESSTRETFDVLFRVQGRGTKALAGAQQGDEINLIGPLGQPFDVSPFALPSSQLSDSSKDSASKDMFHVKQNQTKAIVVGGGVGVPPLVYLSQLLHENGVSVQAIIGARGEAELICRDELNAVCEQMIATTEDGSYGHKGRVTDVLPDLVEQLTDSIEGKEIKPVVYACGPLPMLRAVAQVCARFGVRCQVSLEENMPCGIGVCNGCVVRARQPFANNSAAQVEPSARDLNEIVGNEWSPYQSYRRVCVEGPACWADEIDWEQN